MPIEQPCDSSGSRDNDQKVRFVDTDLSIQPSHHGAVDGEDEGHERGADKYYKDMQSIHGDTVLPSHHVLADVFYSGDYALRKSCHGFTYKIGNRCARWCPMRAHLAMS